MRHKLKLLPLYLLGLTASLSAQQTYNFVPSKPHAKVYDIEAYNDHLALAGSELTCQVATLNYLAPNGGLLWNTTYPEQGYCKYDAVEISPDGRIFAAGDWRVGDDFITPDDGLILVEYDTNGQLLQSHKYLTLPFYNEKAYLSRFSNGQFALSSQSILFLIDQQGELIQTWTDFGHIDFLQALNDSLVAVVDNGVLIVFNIQNGQSIWHTFEDVDPTQVLCHQGRVWWVTGNQWRAFNPVQQNVTVVQGMAPEGYFPRSQGNNISFLSRPTPDLNFIWVYSPQTNTTGLIGQMNLAGRHITDWIPDDSTPWVCGQEPQTDPTFNASYVASGSDQGLVISSPYDAGISNLTAVVTDLDTLEQWSNDAYEVAVTFNLAITIRNYGSLPIHDIAVASHQFGAFNCSERRDFFNFSFSPGLAPDHDTTLQVSVWARGVNQPSGLSLLYTYCMFTLAPNQHIDANASNNDFCLTLVGTRNPANELQSIQVYPNPAQDILHINSPDHLASVQVFDSYGRSVLQASLDGSSPQNIHIGTLPAGMYWVQATSNQGVYRLQKFIKQ